MASSVPTPSTLWEGSNATTTKEVLNALNVASTSSSAHSTTQLVATVIPVVLIASVMIWGLATLSAILQCHSNLPDYLEEVEGDDLSEKYANVDVPSLWEVSLTPTLNESRYDIHHPLAMEAQPNENSSPRAPQHSSPSILATANNSTRRIFRAWSPTISLSRNTSPEALKICSRPAQLTVLIAMPERRDLACDESNNYAIGTRLVHFQDEYREPLEAKCEPVDQPKLTRTYRPIVIDVSAYGYFY